MATPISTSEAKVIYDFRQFGPDAIPMQYAPEFYARIRQDGSAEIIIRGQRERKLKRYLVSKYYFDDLRKPDHQYFWRTLGDQLHENLKHFLCEVPTMLIYHTSRNKLESLERQLYARFAAEGDIESIMTMKRNWNPRQMYWNEYPDCSQLFVAAPMLPTAKPTKRTRSKRSA